MRLESWPTRCHLFDHDVRIDIKMRSPKFLADPVLLWSEMDNTGSIPERVYFWYEFSTGQIWSVWEDETAFRVPKAKSIVKFWTGL